MSFSSRVRSHAVPVVLAVGAALGLTACDPPPDSYVALGDSFTAGPAIMPQDAAFPGCFSSTVNYPHLIAPFLAPPAFRDVSCSGAQTKDMTAPQDVKPDPDNPAQLEALDASTRIVTLGIGGNDIGFTEIATQCGESFLLQPKGSPCRDFYNSGGVDQIGGRIAELAPKLDDVLDRIDAKSPRAKVFVVGYPAILPETTENFVACQATLPVAEGDVAFLRDEVEKRLNATIQYVAVSHGEAYVDTYTPSIGRDACEPPTVRWVEPVAPGADAFPVHPNRDGMEESARAVKSAMRAHGVTVR